MTTTSELKDVDLEAGGQSGELDDLDPQSWIYDDNSSAFFSDESHYLPAELPADIQSVLVFLYVTIIVMGVLGNLLVVAVIGGHRKMHTVTNVFLVSLAVSDTLIAAVNMPFQLSFYLRNEWTLGETLCKLTKYCQGVVIVASILTLTGIAVDRYYAICEPLRARHLHTNTRAALLVAAFWIASLLLLSPQLAIQRLEPFLVIEPESNPPIRIAEMCMEYFSDMRLNVAYTLSIYVFLYIVPVTAIFCAYGRIAHTLWLRHPLGESPNDRRVVEKRRIIRMLIVIAVMFAISWFPFFTSGVYQLLAECDHRNSFIRSLDAFLQLAAYSNCCVNPILYCFLNESFQQRLRKSASAVCGARGRLRRLSLRRSTLSDTVRTTGLLGTLMRKSSQPVIVSNGNHDASPSSTVVQIPLELVQSDRDATGIPETELVFSDDVGIERLDLVVVNGSYGSKVTSEFGDSLECHIQDKVDDCSEK